VIASKGDSLEGPSAVIKKLGGLPEATLSCPSVIRERNTRLSHLTGTDSRPHPVSSAVLLCCACYPAVLATPLCMDLFFPACRNW
jgi:hypothetical protein